MLQKKTEISKQASRPITGRLAPLLNLLLYESKNDYFMIDIR